MIITSNNTIFLETQKEVWKINIYLIGELIKPLEVSVRLQAGYFFTANNVDFYVYELT